MIKNERQYKITRAQLEKLEANLGKIDRDDPNLHPRIILSRVNSLTKTIQELTAEIDEYDRLKNGEIKEVKVNSLAELPIALIKARISAGMTQKQLAEKIGIQEQQVQRYESNDYASISFDRLVEIARILGIVFSQPVSIAIDQPILLDTGTRGILEKIWTLPVCAKQYFSTASAERTSSAIDENETFHSLQTSLKFRSNFEKEISFAYVFKTIG